MRSKELAGQEQVQQLPGTPCRNTPRFHIDDTPADNSNVDDVMICSSANEVHSSCHVAAAAVVVVN